jgi:hypothetical protein
MELASFQNDDDDDDDDKQMQNLQDFRLLP